MVKNTGYKFVDFHAGEQKAKWTRVVDVTSLVKRYDNHDCFATIQKFKSEEYTNKEESYLAPLYFDLDYGDNPDVARLEAVKIVEFFTEELCIDSLAIKTYFSGSKGFHIIIDENVFKYEPANYLHKVFKYISNFLSIKLGTKNDEGKRVPLVSLDDKVYTYRRMIRIPNTRHNSTKLYKIELTHEELATMTMGEIKEMAAEPREALYTSRQLKAAIRPNKEAIDFFEKHLKDYEDLSTYERSTSDYIEFEFNKETMPVCVEHVLSKKWNPENRNNTTIQLAVYFKTARFTEEETSTKLEEWIAKFSAGDSKYIVEKRILNTRNVIRTIYEQGSTYKFGCAFIRSLHGTKDVDGNYEKVPCSGSLCEFVKKSSIDDDNITELTLSETGNSEHTGKLVKTKVMVAGKKSTPYIVPYRIKYSCFSKCDKAGCPLYNVPKKIAFKELTTQDRSLIQMCGVGDSNITGILRDISGIKQCQKFEIDVQECINIEELLVIPMVTSEDEENDYVLRKIYAVGNLNITENRYYELAGYVFPHPKNQEGTILIQSVKPLQDVIESFVYNDEVHKQLEIFQPKKLTVESIDEHIDKILDSLTYNVTGIVERNDVLFGSLLTYHSPLRISVPWNTKPVRGWIETLIVGDTGTGKSEMLEKLRKYIALGYRVNAESTSRTGLTYKMEQSNSGSWYIVWGAWPLADKEFIWIDEAASIPKEEYGQMTLARSDGRLEVKRAVTAETNCRVRAILTTNAIKGKRLSDYVQGIESIKYMFNNEDIRRFDFALFMKATDVHVDKYNTVLGERPEMLSSEQLKNNVLFAWSRNPEHIKYSDDAIELILKYASTLSNKFGHATDVPIVSPSDQKNKLARLSASLAILIHSVGIELDTVIVEKAHVEYIYQYLLKIYRSSSCGLSNYVKLAVKEEVITDERFEKIISYVRDNLKFLNSDAMFESFIKIFASQNYLRLGDLEALLCLDKPDVKQMIQALARIKMVTATTSGYRKTPRFNSFIEKCFIDGIVSGEEEDEDDLFL